MLKVTRNLATLPYIESELRSWRQFKSGALSSWLELQIESEALCTRPVDDSSWYGISAHPDRDAAVATARVLWRPYSDFRDRNNTPSAGRPYSAYWHMARHDVDDAIALWPWGTTSKCRPDEARLLNVAQMRPDVFNKLLNWLQEHTKIDHALCKVKILSLIWSLTERSTQFQIQPSLRSRRH